MKLFIWSLVLQNCFFVVSAQTGSQAKALRKQLFVTDDYDKKVRSANDQTDPTEVDIDFHLVSIHELNEVTETLKTTGFLEVHWKDDFLSWTPTDYGGLDYAFFPQDDVWKPDVALKNSVVEYKQLGVSTLNVEVSSAGEILWQPFQVFQSSCSVDITYFPFDIQTCELKFVAWSYSRAQVDMRAGSKGIVLNEYKLNSEWDIIDSKATVEEESGEASIIFSLTIKRKPQYFFLSIIFPIIMLIILNIFVFVLPCDSGEKASYAITVFLSFAVFMTIVSSSLPEKSDSVGLFSIYIVVQTTQSTLITIVALLLIRMYNVEPDKPVPAGLIIFVRIVTCFKKRAAVAPAVLDSDVEFKDSLKISKAHLSKQENKETTNSLIEDRYDWKGVVNTLDYFFLMVFSATALISTLLCLVLAVTLAEAPHIIYPEK